MEVEMETGMEIGVGIIEKVGIGAGSDSSKRIIRRSRGIRFGFKDQELGQLCSEMNSTAMPIINVRYFFPGK